MKAGESKSVILVFGSPVYHKNGRVEIVATKCQQLFFLAFFLAFLQGL